GLLADLPGDRRLPDHRGGAGMSKQRDPQRRGQEPRDPQRRGAMGGATGAAASVEDLTEDEIQQMQGSMDSESGAPPRQAKAFWPSAMRLTRTFADQKLALAVVLAFGIVSTVMNVWAPAILGYAVDVIFDGVMSGTGVDFGALGRLLAIVMGMY